MPGGGKAGAGADVVLLLDAALAPVAVPLLTGFADCAWTAGRNKRNPQHRQAKRILSSVERNGPEFYWSPVHLLTSIEDAQKRGRFYFITGNERMNPEIFLYYKAGDVLRRPKTILRGGNVMHVTGRGQSVLSIRQGKDYRQRYLQSLYYAAGRDCFRFLLPG
jgi:hypothetical protein